MQTLVERLGVQVYAARPDSAQDHGQVERHRRAGRRREPRPRLAPIGGADHWRPYTVDGRCLGHRSVRGKGAERSRALGREPPHSRRRRYPRGLRRRPRGLDAMAPRGRDARVACRGAATAPGQAGRARARHARRAVRPRAHSSALSSCPSYPGSRQLEAVQGVLRPCAHRGASVDRPSGDRGTGRPSPSKRSTPSAIHCSEQGRTRRRRCHSPPRASPAEA